jgi:hypothetical protein
MILKLSYRTTSKMPNTYVRHNELLLILASIVIFLKVLISYSLSSSVCSINWGEDSP